MTAITELGHVNSAKLTAGSLFYPNATSVDCYLYGDSGLWKKAFTHIISFYIIVRVSFRGEGEAHFPPLEHDSPSTNYLKIVQFCIMNHN